MITFSEHVATHIRATLFCTSNTSQTFSKTIPQYDFPLKLPFSLNDSYVIPLFLKPRSVTDPTFVLILKENAPLFKQSEWCLNGVDRHRHRLFNVRLGLLGIFICIAFLRCRNFLEISLTTVFSSPYMTTGKLPTRVRKKVRHYYTLSRCRLVSTLVVILLLLLVLCGDVHPNPGPGVSFLTHGHRHTDAHLLNTASWNVRTLLDTKRAAGRPSAIVAQELDRYNIDIAAISETRVLGDTEFTDGGYTFFLKGKPLGDKCYHGVGFAVRSKLVQSLQGKYPIGINERLMTMSLPLVNNTLHIISAYAPTLAQTEETK